MRQDLLPPLRAWAWPAILAATTVVGSLAAVCLMPFTALAVIAAATLPWRGALGAVLAAWAFNQAVGFGFLGYPHTVQSAAQGVSLALASLAVLLVARLAGAASGSPLRLGGAFVAGFVVYELLLFAVAHLNGGLWTFAPVYIAQIAANEGVWFVLLATLGVVLRRIAPAVAPPRPLLGAA